MNNGMIGYPINKIYEEIAFLAYYLHWDYHTLLNMEHQERQRWCSEVSAINKSLNGDEKKNLSLLSI